MAIAIQNQNFGVEIELTGITRSNAARIIAMYYGTSSSHVGTCYDTYTATDRKGRTWKAMSDSSIAATKKENGVQAPATDSYKCEIVSSRHGSMLSFTTTIFLKKTGIRIRDSVASLRLSGSSIVSAD